MSYCRNKKEENNLREALAQQWDIDNTPTRKFRSPNLCEARDLFLLAEITKNVCKEQMNQYPQDLNCAMPRIVSSSSYTQTCPPAQRAHSFTQVCSGQSQFGVSSAGAIPLVQSQTTSINPVTRVTMNNRASDIAQPGGTTDPYRQSRQTPVRDTQQNRATGVCEERRTALHNYGESPRPSRGGDTFAESLRKYQSLIKRSTSADLIQRLLAYTQSKHLTKSSYHSKSLRSLTRPSCEATRESVVIKKCSKNIQTYTRSRTESPITDVSAVYGKVERRRRASPGRGSTSRQHDLSASYDYLKIGGSVFSQRSTDVRYLNDVTRFVRDTLRQMYEDENPACPHLIDRYREHRRSFHRTEASTTTTAMPYERSQTVQTEPKRVSVQIPAKPLDLPEPKARSLGCLDYCSELIQNLCPSDNSSDECPCGNNIYEATVNSWLNQVPIIASYHPKDKNELEHLAQTLKIKLKQFEGNDERCLEAISICLNSLPLWLPSDENAQEKYKLDLAKKLLKSLKNNLTNKDNYNEAVGNWLKTIPFNKKLPIDYDRLTNYLVDKLLDVSFETNPEQLREAFQNVLREEVEGWPVDCDPSEKAKLADDFADYLINQKVDEVIFNWVKVLPVGSSTNVDKCEIATNLKTKLKDLVSNSDVDEIPNGINDVAFDVLDKLPIRLSPQHKEELANNLADNLKTIVTLRDSGPNKVNKKALQKATKKDIKDWIDNIPELSAGTPSEKKENEKMIQDLSKSFADLQAQGLSGTEIRKQMLKKIEDKLETAFENRGEHLDPKTKTKLAKELLNKMLDTAERVKTTSARDKPTMKLDSHETLKSEIKNWVEDIPELASFSPDTIKENEKLVNALANKLGKLNQKDLGSKELQLKMRNEIKNKLDQALEERDVQLDSKTKLKHVSKLVVRVTEPLDETSSASLEEIADLMENIPALAANTPEEREANEQLIKDFAERLTELKEQGLDDDEIRKKMLSEIKMKLNGTLDERGESLDPKAINQLALQIFGKLEDASNRPAKVTSKDLQKAAKNDVKNWLEDIPELVARTPSQHKANEKLAEDLAKKFTKLKAEGLDDEEFENKMKMEIQNLLDSALDERGESMDSKTKKKITKQLFDKLNTTSENLKANKSATDLEEAAKKDIQEWLDCIPELAGRTPSQQKIKEKLTNDLAKMLVKLQADGLDDEEIRKRMTKEIQNKLKEAFDQRGQYLDPKATEKLAAQLFGKLKDTTDLVKQASDNVIKNIENTAKKGVKKWLDDIPELQARTPSQQKANKKLTDDLAKTLAKLQAEGLDESEIKKIMMEEIKNKLDSTLDERGESIDPKTKEKMAADLYKILHSSVQQVLPSTEQATKKFVNAVKQDIERWLDDIPELAGRTPSQKLANKKQIDDLAAKITQLQKEGFSADEIKDKLSADIFNILDSSFDAVGVELNPKDRQKLFKQLTDKLETTANKMLPPSVKTSMKLEHAAKQDVKNLLNNIPELEARTPSQQKANEKLTDDLAKTLAKLKAEGLDDAEIRKIMMEEIKNKLDSTLDERGESIDPKTKEKLAADLYNILHSSVQQVLSPTEQAAKKFENAVKQDIERWLDDIPELAGRTPSQKLANKKQIDELSAKITQLQKEGFSADEIKDKLSADIFNILDSSFDAAGVKLSPKVKQKLFKQLNEKIKTTADKMLPPSIKASMKLEHAAKQDVKNMLNNIPELVARTQSQQEANDKLVDDLTRKLVQFKAEGLDDAEIKKRMMSEIKNKLDSTLDERNETLDPKTKEKLAQSLFSKLKTPSDIAGGSDKISGKFSNRGELIYSKPDGKSKSSWDSSEPLSAGLVNIKKEESLSESGKADKRKSRPSKDWFKDIPELTATDSSEVKENKELFLDFEKKVFDLEAQGFDGDQIQENIEEELKGRLELTLTNRGNYLSPSALGLVGNQVMQMLLSSEIQQEIRDKNTTHIEDLSKKLVALVKDQTGDKNPEKETVRKHLNDSAFDEDNDMLDPISVRRTSNRIMLVVENPYLNKSPYINETSILQCIENVPELSSNRLSEMRQNEIFSHELAQQLFDSLNNDEEDDVIKMQLFKRIKSRIDGALENKGEHLNSKTKYKIAEQLLDNIIESIQKYEKSHRRLSNENQGKVNKVSETSIRNTPNNNELKNFKLGPKVCFNKFQSTRINGTLIRDDILKDIINQALVNKSIPLNSISYTVLDTNLTHKNNLETKFHDRSNDPVKNTKTNVFVSKVLQNLVLRWLEDIPELASCSTSESRHNEEVSHALTLRLAVLLSKSIDEAEAHHEMLTAIRDQINTEFNIKGEPVSFKVKTNLANKLFNDIIAYAKAIDKKDNDQIENEELPESTFLTKESQGNLIWGWFNKIPILCEINRAEKFRMIDKLNTTLQGIQKTYTDDDTKDIEMAKEIKQWLMEASFHIEHRLDINSIDKLTRNLIDTIKNVSRKYLNINSDDINVASLMSCANNDEYAGFKFYSYSRNSQAELNLNPLCLKSVNVNPVIFGDLRHYGIQFENELSSLDGKRPFLDGRLSPPGTNDRNKFLRSSTFSNSEYAGSQRRPSAHFTEEKPKVYFVEESNEDPSTADAEKKKTIIRNVPEATQLKMTNIIAQNLDKLNTPQMEKIKEDLVEILINEASLSRAKAEELVVTTLRRIQIKFFECGSEEMELLALLREEFRELIEDLFISKERQAELETYLVDLGYKKLLNSDLPIEFGEYEKEEIVDNIREIAEITSHTAEDFLYRYINEIKAVSYSPTVRKWIKLLLKGQQNKGTLGLNQQCRFEKQAYGIMKNFILEHGNYRRISQIDQIDQVIRKAIGNTIDILVNPNYNGIEKRRLMTNELAQGLHSLSVNGDVNNLAMELLDRLEYINLKIRQPIFSKAEPSPDNLTAYYATYLMNSLTDEEFEIPVSSSTPNDEAQRRRNSELQKNQKQYETKLEKVINDWLDQVPLPPEALPDQKLRATIVDDLIGDIVDTMKYRQLNPDVETTEEEELENLRYQCYRWMSKFLEGENLNIVMSKTDDLIEAIRGLVVLPLVSERRASMKSKQDGTFVGALQKTVFQWIDNLPPSTAPSLAKEYIKPLVADFAHRIDALRGEPDPEEKIMKKINNFLPLLFGLRDKEELKKLGKSLYNEIKEKGYADYTWNPEMSTTQFVEENVDGTLQDMLKMTPFYIASSPQEKKEQEEVANKMSKDIKKLLQKASPGEESGSNIKNEITKHLKNLIHDPDIKHDDELLDKIANNILKCLKPQEMFQDLSKRSSSTDDILSSVVNDWARPLETKSHDDLRHTDSDVKNFIARLKQLRQENHPSSNQHEDAIKEEAIKFLNSAENNTDGLNDTAINEKAEELIKILRFVPLQLKKDRSSLKPFKRPADVLFEYVEDWCDNLPVHADGEKEQTIKQNLAMKLINRIGELNMNPDIFNDNILYEDLLHDEIDEILEEVPKNPELVKYLPALKKDLISKIMEARQQMYNELVGKAYKQQLRDAVSASMGLPENLSPDEQASFELLKDKVADAFINLHYAPSLPCNDERRNVYRKKISDEVDRFCGEILNHYPCSRIHPDRVKRELNKALVRVPVPKDDSMKSEVEQARLKDLVTDWMKEIPLRQETATDRLHRYKLAAVLAKNLHENELEKEADPFSDGDIKAHDDITKFLKKLLLVHGQESTIPYLADELIKRIANSMNSRKFISARRSKSIESQAEVCTRYPCTLSGADRNHLAKIRERLNSQPCYTDIATCPTCPPLKSACSQTDSPGHWAQQRQCFGPKLQRPQVCSRKDATCMTTSSQPAAVSPQVIVREYAWDSTDSSKPDAAPQGVQTPRQSTFGTQSAQPTCPPAPQTFPYANFTPQRPSYAESPPRPCPLIQPCPQPYRPPQQSYQQCPQHSSQQHYNPQPCQQQQQPPQPTDSRPYMYYPQEKRVPCGSKAFQHRSPEASSGEEGAAGSSRSFWRQRPTCQDDCKQHMRRESRGDKFAPEPETEWSDEEFWDTCEKLRGRRQDAPCSRRRERVEEKTKCRCKDRILVSCKGLSSKNRFHDMCQNCGSNCPHPTNLFFKR